MSADQYLQLQIECRHINRIWMWRGAGGGPADPYFPMPDRARQMLPEWALVDPPPQPIIMPLLFFYPDPKANPES